MELTKTRKSSNNDPESRDTNDSQTLISQIDGYIARVFEMSSSQPIQDQMPCKYNKCCPARSLFKNV